MNDDRILLCKAIEIAKQGIEKGCGPFGAVIARDGAILAEASNRVTLDSDPTAHAEVVAIRQAAASLKSHDLGGCTIYCSCEPCPMCLGAIYWAGIPRVVYACDRSDAAAAGFSDKDIYDEIMLDPAQRKITFKHIAGAGGEEIFKAWEQYESKIPY
ncbi:MAG: nucleoside deaminase [Bacteroidales bacterium]|jgi:tRNA(Arg) A34 adenosine deaminase TadA|nr:nucleoside deaminase [Bacteroidales bacterium]